MKQIGLTQGKYALVDDADFEWLNQWKWFAVRQRNGNWYAVRNSTWKNVKGRTIYMHRKILRLTVEDYHETDHKDHNGLNNQRENLRIATRMQNQYNQKPQIGKSSQYKGVRWHKRDRKWRAEIKLNKKTRWIGAYNSEIEAARSYDRVAKELFGEFAYTNFNL